MASLNGVFSRGLVEFEQLEGFGSGLLASDALAEGEFPQGYELIDAIVPTFHDRRRERAAICRSSLVKRASILR